MSHTITTEYVKSIVESREGYKLLSEYKDTKTPVTIKCSRGHTYEAKWHAIKDGRDCSYCKWGSRTKEEIIKYVEEYGLEVLDIRKENKVFNLLKIKCSIGHICDVKFSDFKRSKHKCSKCADIETGKQRRHTYDFVKETIESNKGYRLLSKEYKQTHNKIKIQCPEFHIFWTTFNSFYWGTRCPQCAKKRNGATQRLSYDYVKEYIESFDDIKLLSEEYKNSTTKLEIKCPNDHTYWMSWSNFRKGHRCPLCYRQQESSKSEKEIVGFLKQRISDIVCNCWSVIVNPNTNCNMELDIWLPKMNKAIEFNGVYWHSTEVVKKRDRIKKEQCSELGINLLIIEEENWEKDKDNEFKKILKFLELN